jgi:hypothetical protein
LVKQKRYLGNVNTLGVHDTTLEQANCQLEEILQLHRRWYDSLGEARRDHPYNYCAWCLGGSTR